MRNFILWNSCFWFAVNAWAQTSKQPAFHYFTNGQIAVKILPWENEKQNSIVLDSTGNQTYLFEDFNSAAYGSSITSFHFKGNGSILKAITSYNPGASMYWSETVITFSDNNIPLTRTIIRQPVQTTELPVVENWDASAKTWKPRTVITKPVLLKPIDSTSREAPLLWDDKNNKWVKQEVIECRPLPQTQAKDSIKTERVTTKKNKVKRKKRRTKTD